jgi:5-methylcytosine-specific restriction endonuclease McrA
MPRPKSLVCTKCGQPKDGACKPCKNAAARAWSAANVEKRRQINERYYEANKDEIRRVNDAWLERNKDAYANAQKAYYQANRDTIRTKAAEYHIANKEKLNERSAMWRRANPEKCRIHSHNRRALIASAGGKLSADLFERLFVLQKGRCACCSKPLGDNPHLDHIMPLAMGGANEDSNMQLLRQTCNNRKHAKHPVDYMQERGFLL